MLSHLISVSQRKFWNFNLKLRMEKRKGMLKNEKCLLSRFLRYSMVCLSDCFRVSQRGHEKGISHSFEHHTLADSFILSFFRAGLVFGMRPRDRRTV